MDIGPTPKLILVTNVTILVILVSEDSLIIVNLVMNQTSSTELDVYQNAHMDTTLLLMVITDIVRNVTHGVKDVSHQPTRNVTFVLKDTTLTELLVTKTAQITNMPTTTPENVKFVTLLVKNALDQNPGIVPNVKPQPSYTPTEVEDIKNVLNVILVTTVKYGKITEPVKNVTPLV
jgi:hypothetical protein